LHYFPGDGEAIVRAEVAYQAHLVQVERARAAQGQVRSTWPLLHLDYAGRPLSGESSDTLYVDLVASQAEVSSNWQVRLYSSLEPNGQAAHQVAVELEVQPLPAVEWSLRPLRVFAGEPCTLQVAVYNADQRGRVLEEVGWDWPADLVLQAGEARRQWPNGLNPGQRDTLDWPVRVEREEAGTIELVARARLAGLSEVPLAAQQLRVDPVPEVRLEADFMEVGKRESLTCVWTNASGQPLEVEALRLEINGAFAEASLAPKDGQARLVSDEGGQRRYVLLEGIGTLAPAEALQVVLEVVPLRPGPFSWPSAVRPRGRDLFIPLRGQTTVRAGWAAPEDEPDKQSILPTDLQLMSQALGTALHRQMGDLPLRPGAALHLQAHDRSERNWVVEDALIKTLRERGYRILVRPSREGKAHFDLLYYRLVDARVVYAPQGRGWLPWRAARQQRQAYGDLLLRVERGSDRVVCWEQRVQAYEADEVPGKSMDALGGTEVVKRMVIEPDNKAIERGLSASIVGGLVYIFFLL
jgi:hypothetical protein